MFDKKAWRIKNREKLNQQIRDWKRRNKDRMKEYQKRYWSKNGAKANEKRRRFRDAHPDYDKNYTRRIRQEALTVYGGKCACCGEHRYEFLALDHMDGFGSAHRRKLKIEGQKFVFWLKRQNYPTGFQVLCHNCNMSFGFNGYCPHHPEIVRPVLRRKR